MGHKLTMYSTICMRNKLKAKVNKMKLGNACVQ